jgi:hypothetical protein
MMRLNLSWISPGAALERGRDKVLSAREGENIIYRESRG